MPMIGPSYTSHPGWLENPDPLGISARERARQTQREMNPYGFGGIGPLSDPLWDAYFQTLRENNVTQMGDESFGAKKGMFESAPTHTSTFNPLTQQSAVATSRSNQLGRVAPSMQGILKAAGIQMPQSDTTAVTGQRVGSTRPRIQTQRGTSGNNQTRRA